MIGFYEIEQFVKSGKSIIPAPTLKPVHIVT